MVVALKVLAAAEPALRIFLMSLVIFLVAVVAVVTVVDEVVLCVVTI